MNDDTTQDTPAEPTQAAPQTEPYMHSGFNGPVNADDYFKQQEDGEREPIVYNGPQDATDFAPPGTDLRDAASRGESPYSPEQQEAEDQRAKALAKIQAERQGKTVAAPADDNKPTSRSRATGKAK